MINEIVKNLNCTEEEFIDHIDSIDMSELQKILEGAIIKKYQFSEKYNGVDIENPANGKYYYICEILDRVFLQNLEPYVAGNIPLNDDNIEEVMNSHKERMISETIESEKIKATIDHFSNK